MRAMRFVDEVDSSEERSREANPGDGRWVAASS